MEIVVDYDLTLHRTVMYHIDMEAYEEWLEFQQISIDEAGPADMREFIQSSETVIKDLDQSHRVVEEKQAKVRLQRVHY